MLEGVMVHIWVALNVPRPMEFTAFIDESVKKKKSISSQHGGFIILPGTCKKKIFWTEIYVFFVIIRFSFTWISSKVFKEGISFSFKFNMLYMYKKTLEAFVWVNFGLLGENFVTSFI